MWHSKSSYGLFASEFSISCISKYNDKIRVITCKWQMQLNCLKLRGKAPPTFHRIRITVSSAVSSELQLCFSLILLLFVLSSMRLVQRSLLSNKGGTWWWDYLCFSRALWSILECMLRDGSGCSLVTRKTNHRIRQSVFWASPTSRKGREAGAWVQSWGQCLVNHAYVMKPQ